MTDPLQKILDSAKNPEILQRKLLIQDFAAHLDQFNAVIQQQVAKSPDSWYDEKGIKVFTISTAMVMLTMAEQLRQMANTLPPDSRPKL